MFSALVVLALLIFALTVRYWEPSMSGTLRLPRLQASVDVQHDVNGVVHIVAANEHDLFYAQGALSARHRLWQMEFYRRVGAGRLSEVAGNATLNIDRYFRTLGLRRAALVTRCG